MLLKCCYLCVQVSIFGALSISRQIHNRENLGQTFGDYPIYRQNLGWSAKSKIPDRLGFSRHMKTRLKAAKFAVTITENLAYFFTSQAVNLLRTKINH